MALQSLGSDAQSCQLEDARDSEDRSHTAGTRTSEQTNIPKHDPDPSKGQLLVCLASEPEGTPEEGWGSGHWKAIHPLNDTGCVL